MQDEQRMIAINVYQGEHSLTRDNAKLGSYTIRGLAPKPAGEQSVRVRFTYDLNGILEVDMTVESTGKTETLVIESGANRLTKQQLKAAREAMERLKFHPRDALPNATLLARADALHVELTGIPRAHLAEAIAQFRLALEHQDAALIARVRDQLAALVDALRR
jgi:molecular chaperone HscC